MTHNEAITKTQDRLLKAIKCLEKPHEYPDVNVWFDIIIAQTPLCEKYYCNGVRCCTGCPNHEEFGKPSDYISACFSDIPTFIKRHYLNADKENKINYCLTIYGWLETQREPRK